MKPTELLITAYDGDRSLFATSLTPEKAYIIVAGIDETGDAVVEQGFEMKTRAFESIAHTLREVVAPR